MPTKEVDRAELANTTGPAPADDVVAGTCERCGRSELVKTVMPKEDDARTTMAIVDTAGDEVKASAHVTVCALCGAIQSARPVKDGGRFGPKRTSRPKTAKKRKTTTTARKSTQTRKRASTRKTRTRGR